MKTAVVTASTKGIGRAIGISLLKEGCYVYFNYYKDEIAADQLDTELKQSGFEQYSIIKANMSDYNDAMCLVNEIKDCSNGIDYLILNAGITDRTSFPDITYEQWNNVMQTNLTIPFFVTQALSSSINKNGRIIFIGSLMGEFPHAQSISYGVSKSAVHFLTKSLVKFFCDKQTTVNCIVPGFVDTPWQKAKKPDHRKRIEDKISLGRFADPSEIADLCISIIDNQYLNGSVITIDGGYSYQ